MVAILSLSILLRIAEVTVGFLQSTYTFGGGAGNVNLMLVVSGLADVLECPVDVTIEYTDGPKASECVILSSFKVITFC